MNRFASVLFPLLGACAESTIVRIPCEDGQRQRTDDELLVSLERDSDEGAVPIARGFAIGDADVHADLMIRGGHCVGFSVAVARGIEDADLEIFDHDGGRLVVDDGPARFARVRLCATEDARVYVRGRAASGAGDLALLASPVDDDGSVSRVSADHPDAAARFHRSASDALTARGFRVVPMPRSVHVDAGVPLRTTVAIAPGECIVAIARSESELSVRLLDDRDRELTSDRGRARDLRIEHCSASDARGASIEFGSPTAIEVFVAVGIADAIRIGGRTGLGGAR